MTDDKISLQEAAERLGVHYMTAYRYVRLGHLPAERDDGGRWHVRARDVDALKREQAKPRKARGKRGRPQWTSYRGRLRTRLLAGDHTGAWNVAEQALASGASPTDVYVDVLGPVLEDIGTRWERGSLTVGEEHRASTAARLVVGRMSPRFARRGRTRGTVVLGAASGDTHGLPLAMVADVLRGAAFDVVDLGADTPAESFVQMIRRTDAVALGISGSTDGAVDAVAKTIRAVRKVHPDIPIMVGGPAFPTAADAKAVGADGWAPDAREVPTVVENLLAEANQA